MGFWSRRKKTGNPQRSDEEEQRELEEERKIKEVYQQIEGVDRFLGSLDEYIQLKIEEGKLTGIETIVPMSTGRSEKWVFDPKYTTSLDTKMGITTTSEKELFLELISKGCIGLIRYQRTYNTGQPRCLGIPVKMKLKNEPYR
ncbi:hypothetical protein COV93_00195 [Candidatus Woesearchaeota archaeon CG11_big_fil_rev_8_21_14_0_20_43_8]|nr:MAG: hypothetical protein COV93_00195 [Candidatus Woesearchaeota archaeon CG11_big_fil_rev_8_21_14_0_20_43_8]